MEVTAEVEPLAGIAAGDNAEESLANTRSIKQHVPIFEYIYGCTYSTKLNRTNIALQIRFNLVEMANLAIHRVCNDAIAFNKRYELIDSHDESDRLTLSTSTVGGGGDGTVGSQPWPPGRSQRRYQRESQQRLACHGGSTPTPTLRFLTRWLFVAPPVRPLKPR